MQPVTSRFCAVYRNKSCVTLFNSMAYKINNTLKPCHMLCQNLGKTVFHCSTPTSSPTFASQSSVQSRPCAINQGLLERTEGLELTHRFMRKRVHTKWHWTDRTSRRHTRCTTLEASRVHTALFCFAVAHAAKNSTACSMLLKVVIFKAARPHNLVSNGPPCCTARWTSEAGYCNNITQSALASNGPPFCVEAG